MSSRRSSLAAVNSLVGSCVLAMSLPAAVGCSRSSLPTSLPPDATLSIEMMPTEVVITNKTGTMLASGSVNLMPSGFPRPYFIDLPRMYNGEKRSFPLDAFRMIDGTKYVMNVTRISSVKVSATDVLGKTHEYELGVR